MEHNPNVHSANRPAGSQGRGLKQPSGGSPTETPARSAARREDFASADALAQHKDSAEHASSLHSLIPSFTPVPRLKDRSNGWKPHIQLRFIHALAETGSVAAACRRVGRTDHGAYQLRRHPQAGEFRAAWDAALDLGVRRIEDHAMDRALYGAEEVVVQNGETIVKRRRYNERLVMFILRNRAPERFSEGGANGLSAVDKMRLKRLKQQWRAEWAEEQHAREPSIEDVRREMLSKVQAIQRADRARWTEREWTAHHELQAAHDERKEREEAEAREEQAARERQRSQLRALGYGAERRSPDAEEDQD